MMQRDCAEKNPGGNALSTFCRRYSTGRFLYLQEDLAALSRANSKIEYIFGFWIGKLKIKNLSHRIFLRPALLFAFFQFLAGAIVFAGSPSDREIEKQIENGIERTILNDFPGAESIFKNLIHQYPAQPFGYFYLGATYQAEMLDRENYDKLDDFTAAMERAIELSKEVQEQNGEDAWACFFEGSAYLYRSFMDNKLKKVWGAYRNAVKGAGRLEKVIELDSTFYDAYLGVGSYKYWKSSKTKMLAWLPILKDERDRGINMVQTAVQKGNFVKLIGRDQLAWILLDSGKNQEALQLAIANHRLYPESRFFMWTLVEIYYRDEQWEEAFNLYQKLLYLLRELPHNNHYNEVTCLLRMAEVYYMQGDFISSDSLASEILSLKLSEEVRERVKPKLKRALKLKQLCAPELTKADKLSE